MLWTPLGGLRRGGPKKDGAIAILGFIPNSAKRRNAKNREIVGGNIDIYTSETRKAFLG